MTSSMSIIAFLSVLASFLLVFVVFVVVIVAAVFLGIGLYKLINKNKIQETQTDEYDSDETDGATEESN